jgi:hypothetical protein
LNTGDDDLSAAAFAMPLMMTGPREDAMPEYRLDQIFYLWECWHFRSNWKVEKGFPTRAAGRFQTSYATGETLEDKGHQMDARVAAAVEALVNGLPLVQQHAVYNEHLATVFTVRGDIKQHYQDARKTIRSGLIRRGIQ